jgi:hypothetical protein
LEIEAMFVPAVSEIDPRTSDTATAEGQEAYGMMMEEEDESAAATTTTTTTVVAETDGIWDNRAEIVGAPPREMDVSLLYNSSSTTATATSAQFQGILCNNSDQQQTAPAAAVR